MFFINIIRLCMKMNMETKRILFHFEQLVPIHSFHDFWKWQMKLRHRINIFFFLQIRIYGYRQLSIMRFLQSTLTNTSTRYSSRVNVQTCLLLFIQYWWPISVTIEGFPMIVYHVNTNSNSYTDPWNVVWKTICGSSFSSIENASWMKKHRSTRRSLILSSTHHEHTKNPQCLKWMKMNDNKHLSILISLSFYNYGYRNSRTGWNRNRWSQHPNRQPTVFHYTFCRVDVTEAYNTDTQWDPPQIGGFETGSNISSTTH